MTYTDLLNILRSAQRGQFKRIEAHEGRETAVYTQDLALTVAQGATVNDRFTESWATSFADPAAGESYWFEALYAGVVVYRHLFVAVDGHRAHIPIPTHQSTDDGKHQWYLPPHDYELGAVVADIFDDESRYHDYVGRAGIAVAGQHEAKTYDTNARQA